GLGVLVGAFAVGLLGLGLLLGLFFAVERTWRWLGRVSVASRGALGRSAPWRGSARRAEAMRPSERVAGTAGEAAIAARLAEEIARTTRLRLDEADRTIASLADRLAAAERAAALGRGRELAPGGPGTSPQQPQQPRTPVPQQQPRSPVEPMPSTAAAPSSQVSGPRPDVDTRLTPGPARPMGKAARKAEASRHAAALRKAEAAQRVEAARRAEAEAATRRAETTRPTPAAEPNGRVGAGPRAVNGVSRLDGSPTPRVTARAPESSLGPVSAHMAWGADLVRASVREQSCAVTVAATATRLAHLRAEATRREWRSTREGTVARWCLLAQVPAVLILRCVIDPGWLGDALGSASGVAGLAAMGILTVVGARWVWRVTEPPFRLRRGSAPEPALEAMRSVVATEELALRLAAREAPDEAWHRVATSWRVPVEAAAAPPATPGTAIALTAGLWRDLTRRRVGEEGVVARVTVAPYLLCLLPALALALLL
ncbi:MAG TPA: hypothetical protein VF314_12800, partial [Actinomycetes bacterium]